MTPTPISEATFVRAIRTCPFDIKLFFFKISQGALQDSFCMLLLMKKNLFGTDMKMPITMAIILKQATRYA